jgi:hypothetical protein
MIARPVFLFDKTESFDVNGEESSIKKCTPEFPLWHEPKPDWWQRLATPYKSKPLISFNGTPFFAELAILNLLKADGWEGYWVDNWAKCFRRTPLERCASLPGAAKAKFDSVARENSGKRAGCWDVFMWKEDQFRFYEAKWQGHDKVTPAERLWLQAACRAGMKPDDFAVVQWVGN